MRGEGACEVEVLGVVVVEEKEVEVEEEEEVEGGGRDCDCSLFPDSAINEFDDFEVDDDKDAEKHGGGSGVGGGVEYTGKGCGEVGPSSPPRAPLSDGKFDWDGEDDGITGFEL